MIQNIFFQSQTQSFYSTIEFLKIQIPFNFSKILINKKYVKKFIIILLLNLMNSLRNLNKY